MKTTILLLISLLLLSASFGQTVYTCKNGTISASNTSEGSTPTKNIWHQQYLNWASLNGMSASDILAEADGSYNCHAYAWHLTEGNSNKVWIANTNDYSQSGGCYINNDNINKYWTDGCFIQVCNQSEADKIHYYCGDHSAVNSTVVAGKFESKWGVWPLVRHNPTTVPSSYEPSQIRYYASTKISGDETGLCSGTRTFSVKSITGATYTWSVNNALAIVSGQGTNQLTVQRNGNANGMGIISVQIATLCSSSPSTSPSKTFWVGTVAASDIDLGSLSTYPYVCPNTTYSVFFSPAFPGFTYEIGVLNGTFTQQLPNNPQFFYVHIGNYTPSQYVDAEITARINSGCGWSDYKYLSLYSDPISCPPGGGCEFGCLFSISPNPGNDEIYFEIDEEEWSATKVNGASNKYKLVLKDNLGQEHLKIQTEERKVKLDSRNIPQGIYYLQINFNQIQATRRVVINK